MKFRIALFGALGATTALLAYLIVNPPSSPLGEQINQGIAKVRAKQACLEEINTRVRLDVKKAKLDLCASIQQDPANCKATDVQIRAWLEVQIDRCVKDRLRT